MDEGQVVEGLNEVDVGAVLGRLLRHFVPRNDVVVEYVLYGVTDVGVEVHGVHEVHLGVLLGQFFDGLTHVEEALSEVFAAVAGDENQLSDSVGRLLRSRSARGPHNDGALLG